MFVDPSGRRARVARRTGRILALPAAAYVVAVASSLMGGPSLPSALLPDQVRDAGTAVYRAIAPAAGSDERPGSGTVDLVSETSEPARDPGVAAMPDADGSVAARAVPGGGGDGRSSAASSRGEGFQDAGPVSGAGGGDPASKRPGNPGHEKSGNGADPDRSHAVTEGSPPGRSAVADREQGKDEGKGAKGDPSSSAAGKTHGHAARA